MGKLIYGNALGAPTPGAFFYLYRFITLTPVASPTKRLQIVLGRQAPLGYRHNVVDFQQQVRLVRSRYAAVSASIVIAFLDMLAQLAGHKRPLTGHALAELDLLGQIDNKAVQIVNIHNDVVGRTRISARAGILSLLPQIRDSFLASSG